MSKRRRHPSAVQARGALDARMIARTGSEPAGWFGGHRAGCSKGSGLSLKGHRAGSTGAAGKRRTWMQTTSGTRPPGSVIAPRPASGPGARGKTVATGVLARTLRPRPGT